MYCFYYVIGLMNWDVSYDKYGFLFLLNVLLFFIICNYFY